LILVSLETHNKVDLTSAKTVIGGGISLGSSKNFKLLEELAALFENATIGATRAAVDAGFVLVDLQIG